MSENQLKKTPSPKKRKPPLKLPPPRIWTMQNLMDFLGVSVSWVYKRTMANAEDPIPRIIGVKQLKFDTANPLFRDWMRRRLGYIDKETNHE